MRDELSERTQRVDSAQKPFKVESQPRINSLLEREIKKFRHMTATQVFGVVVFATGIGGFVHFVDSIGEGRQESETNSRVLLNLEKSPEDVAEVVTTRREIPKIEGRPIAVGEQSRLIKNVFADTSAFELAAINAKVGLYKKEVKKDVDLDQMQVFLNGWGDHLEIQAKKHRLDPQILKGMILIESSGDPRAISPTGAVGVAQLMPDAAKRFGVDPENSFEAVIGMCEYLDELRSYFGDDLGMAIWAYHAGEGNVMNALRYYFIDKYNTDIGNYEKSLRMPTDEMRLGIERNAQELIKKHDVNVFRLLQNKAVGENVLVDLEDDTQNYVHKAIAGALILKN